jgi:flavin-dependent dehydrogenase
MAFDVAVLGGGPAGSIVSLCLARRGWRVALFEATEFEAPRYGETLPPEMNPVLQELGLWDAFQSLSPIEAPGIISVWGSPVPQEQDFLRNPHGCGWHIDRNRFDEMLCLKAADAGAKLFLKNRGAPCRLPVEVKADFRVDASGRNGLPMESGYSREEDDTLIAIVLHVQHAGAGVSTARRDMRTCIESTPSGWWYTARLRDETIAMFFADPGEYTNAGISPREQLADAPLTRSRLEHGNIVQSQVVRVSSSCRRKIFGTDWMAVGDSASSFDPLSGRGIFKALRQGVLAAEALDAKLRGNDNPISEYASLVRSEFEDYVRQRREFYAGESRWLDRTFWRGRARSREVLESAESSEGGSHYFRRSL